MNADRNLLMAGLGLLRTYLEEQLSTTQDTLERGLIARDHQRTSELIQELADWEPTQGHFHT